MEFVFQPSNQERFFRRQLYPLNHVMRRQCGFPFDASNEDFHSFEWPFSLVKQHVAFIVPKGNYFQGKKTVNSCESKQQTSEAQQEKKEEIVEISSEDKTGTETKCEKNNEKSQKATNSFINIIPLEEIFPSFDNFSPVLRAPEEELFEVSVNLRGCDPDKVKVEIKDGVLKVEGKKESPNGFTFIRHEQTIPKNVSSEALKASLLPEGVLKVRQVKQDQNIPIAILSEENAKQPQKTQNESQKEE